MTSSPTALADARLAARATARRRPADPRAVAAALVALTKPRIIELLLVTTVPTMVLAQRGLPSLAAGPGHPGRRHPRRRQRQHDQLLRRPRHRRGDEAHLAPPAGQQAGRGHAGRGAASGASCSARSPRCCSAWRPTGSPRLLADAAIAFYVFVYTLLLKRRTPANIVIGGAAGCFPVLVGWAAVKGTSACRPWCCSRSSSSGPRRTSGPWR